MWKEKGIIIKEHWPPLVATSDSHLSGMGGGRIWGEVGTPSHPLSIYGHEVYTQRGILSLELMNGEEGRGSCQSVYKEREGKSLMWNPQQANTYRGAETKRNTVNCFFFLFLTTDHFGSFVENHQKGGLKENKLLYYLFTPSLFFFFFLPFLFPSLGETDF